jgi:hypothetical protein
MKRQHSSLLVGCSTTTSSRSELENDCFAVFSEQLLSERSRSSDAREKAPLDREREYQQDVYESLRNSGFEARTEACWNEISKGWRTDGLG